VAQGNCTDNGYDLVTLDDAAEEDWLTPIIDADWAAADMEAWTGFNDRSVEGDWVWASGSASAYRNWYPGEPNGGGGENCVHLLWEDGRPETVLWNDDNCEDWKSYVCESP